MWPGNNDTARDRILVVDDNEYNRDVLARRLARRDFDVDAVADGYAALDALERQKYSLVLLDIMMPGIDGYEVLTKVREKSSHVELPVIMVTAKDESADIVRALKLGANDYLTKPVDFAVALARINTHILVQRSQAAVLAAHERMKRDIDAAATTQRKLLPQEPLDDSRADFGWKYFPCDELGGDMLNIFRIGERFVGIYVLDVSGHGVRSALLAFAMSRYLAPSAGPGSVVAEVDRDGSIEPLPPAVVAARLNAEFPPDTNGGLICTLQYGLLDLELATFSFISAGHPDPQLQSSGPSSVTLESIGGPPLGVLDNPLYEQRTIDLAPGDRVVMITDGVYEQEDEQGQQFGFQRYREQLASTRAESVSFVTASLKDQVVAWAGAHGTGDDVSVLAFDYRGNETR